jgi:hypothetical protein
LKRPKTKARMYWNAVCVNGKKNIFTTGKPGSKPLLKRLTNIECSVYLMFKVCCLSW